MINFKDSDYAANKNSQNIVYRFVDGTIEITLESYLLENPGKTENDFYALKTLSDSIYLKQDREHYRQTWKDISIECLNEGDALSVISPEEYIFGQFTRVETMEWRREVGLHIFKKLTETQKKRYWMYHVDGLTLREIADKDGAKFQSVAESIMAAEKKINIFLKEVKVP